MAFATSNVQTESVGKLRMTYGQWTGSLGDAAGSLTVGGGQMWFSAFNTNLASGPQQVDPVVATPSGTAGILTLTIPNQNAVTAGTFIVLTS